MSRWDFEKYDKPVYISDIVGDVIDSTERQTYELFPGIDGFVQAAILENPSGGYRWEILTKNAKYVAFNNDPQAMLILADYIERYEDVTEFRSKFEEKWNIVDYDELGHPITQEEVDHVMLGIKRLENRRIVGLATTGCLSGALLGCAIGFRTHSQVGYHPYPDIEISKEAIAVGAAVGAAAGFAIGLLARSGNGKKALEAIKEGRRPRVAE